MGVPAPADGQVLGAAMAHGPADVPLGAATRAPDYDVGAAVAAVVLHLQLRMAHRRAGTAVVHELPVGEVVQVPVHAGQDKSRGDRERLAAAPRAVLVEEPGLVRTAGLVVDEHPVAGVQRREPVAGRTPQPLRERDDRHSDPGGLAVRVHIEAVQPGRRPELGDRRAEQLGHGGQQPGLVQRFPVGHRVEAPVVEAADKDGEVRQVDEGADAAGEHQVARPHGPDAAPVLGPRHQRPPAWPPATDSPSSSASGTSSPSSGSSALDSSSRAANDQAGWP